jgi:hypothetical protein
MILKKYQKLTLELRLIPIALRTVLNSAIGRIALYR